MKTLRVSLSLLALARVIRPSGISSGSAFHFSAMPQSLAIRDNELLVLP